MGRKARRSPGAGGDEHPSGERVEIGAGIAAAGSHGSEVQDEISYDKAAKKFRRSSNRAGGLEGGITNGEDVIVRGYLKPISTLRKPLGTANMVTKEPIQAAYERSDWCVVPAAGVAGEAMVALVLARCFSAKIWGRLARRDAAEFRQLCPTNRRVLSRRLRAQIRAASDRRHCGNGTFPVAENLSDREIRQSYPGKIHTRH